MRFLIVDLKAQMDSNQQTELAVRLKLITALCVGDKISSRYLAIQRDTIYTKLCRAFYGESRANTVVFVRNTINQVVALIKTPTQPALDAQVKASFVIDLKQSIVGLTALSETYTGDVRVCCELAQIIEIVKRNT